jgi:quinoprotein glucose dehydrogenase
MVGKRTACRIALAALAAAGLSAAGSAASRDVGNEAARGWPAHGGNPGHTQSSPLDQINTRNVARLAVAWVHHTGDARADDRSQIQCNPIVVGSVLYGTSAGLKAFALDAATGRELWTFDPFAGPGERPVGVNRGLMYWADGGDARILFGAGPRLYALEARTGRPVAGFGREGSVDLREDLGRDVTGLHLVSTTPGVVWRDLVIMGMRVGEGPAPAAPGHIRAYDVRSGRLRWTFHTIPWPGETGYETWPEDAWKRVGGANTWSGISLDAERGVVFAPTGSPAYDFWGGNRVGANLFANCVLALDAATGKRLWHYQVVHHDVWDRDLPAAPILLSLRRGGRRIEALAQITKSAHVFLLDRRTGQPLLPVEEQAVPASDLDGEKTWPTQPLPVKPPPFARQLFTEDEVTDRTPEAHREVLARLRALRTGRQFIPPSRQGTVILPGFDGGGEWGGAAVDPATGILYVNSSEMAWVLTMVDVPGRASTPVGERVYVQYCASCHGLDRRGGSAQGQLAPSLVDVRHRFESNDLVTLIDKGKGTMPSFGFIPPGEKKAVAAFLRGDRASAGGEEEERVEAGVPFTSTGYNRFFDAEGYPAMKPPWGTLNAIDLARGETVWRVPLGEYPELTRRGIPPTGTENYGGPIVTAGGLVFIAASRDEMFHAFDKRTGRLLWQARLPAGGYATPSTYEVGGRQYVVVAAGGGKMGTRSGDAYVAFALP